MEGYLMISNNVELLRLAVDEISHITADGDYCNFYLSKGEHRMVSKQLGQVAQLIGQQVEDPDSRFVRVGRSLIVNLAYIRRINLSQQNVELVDRNGGCHTVNASREALAQLKSYIEKNL